MLEAIISTLQIMGWLGITLGILVVVNVVTSTIYNTWSSKELLHIFKNIFFYACDLHF